MPDSPGKVLSSLNAADVISSHGDATIAGCTAAFFHFLDRLHGRRLLPHKDLFPAERAQRTSKIHKEEKLPMARLLLIADEKRGLESDDIKQQLEGPKEDAALLGDDVMEKKTGRTPSVIARLMGLESMPSPDPPRFQQQPEAHLFSPYVESASNIQNRDIRDDVNLSLFDANLSLFEWKACELYRKRLGRYSPSTYYRESSTNSWHQQMQYDGDIDAFSSGRVSSLSGMIISPTSHRKGRLSQMDVAVRLIVSPSKAPDCKKVGSFIKTPLPSKGTAKLFETAAKLLETNLQHPRRCGKTTRNEGIYGKSTRKTQSNVPNRDRQVSSCTMAPSLELEQKRGSHSFKGLPTVRNHYSQGNTSDNNDKNGMHQEKGSKHLSRDAVYQKAFKHMNKQRASLQQEKASKHTINFNNDLGPRKRVPSKISVYEKVRTKNAFNRNALVKDVDQISRKHGRMRSQSFQSDSTTKHGSIVKSSQKLPTTSRSARGSENLVSPSRVGSNRVVDDMISSNRHLKSSQESNGSLMCGSNVLEWPVWREERRSNFSYSVENDNANTMACSESVSQAEHLGDYEESNISVDNSRLDQSPSECLEAMASNQGSHDSDDTQNSESLNSSLHQERKADVSYSGKTTAAILQELLMALNASRAGTACTDDEPGWLRVSKSTPLVAKGKSVQMRVAEPITPLASVALKKTPMECESSSSKEYVAFEESQSVLDSLCTEDCGQPSPVSIFESPFQDAVSNTSESCESAQARASLNGSNTGMYDSGNYPEEESDLLEDRAVTDCDRLLDAISRMHHIDPATIGLHIKSDEAAESVLDCNKDMTMASLVSMISSGDSFLRKLLLTGPLLDPRLFDKLEEQVQQMDWTVSTSSTSLCKEKYDEEGSVEASKCDAELSLKVAAQNTQLVHDCIDEALRLAQDAFLSPFGFPYASLVEPPLSTHLFFHIYRQIDEWKGMEIGMNLDDMVEKEMNGGAGRWFAWSHEVDIIEDIESGVLKCLLEELVSDMINTCYCKVATSRSNLLMPLKCG